MKSQYIDKTSMSHVLALLTPENRAIIDLSIRYGLRVGDVLALKREQIQRRSFTITEEKTGKKRRMKIPEKLAISLMAYSSARDIYIFPHRLTHFDHRTRQAVYKDIRRAAVALRMKEHVSPHSARKIYAVNLYRKTGDLEKVQTALNHTSLAVTMIYALSDELTKRSKSMQ